MNQTMQFLKSNKNTLQNKQTCFEWLSRSPSTFYHKIVTLGKGCLGLLNAHLCSIGRFIYGFISYEKVQIINTFHYSPLSLVPHFG